ncbi:structural protein [Pseudomonas phage KPP25]|uniref:Structural protein n=1 Tax=Pseudomonas phage KPP25 TaxID=1462608 RepID=X5I2P0_BPKP2|nr:virion structural protein [Pseudomonas phage KPP25]BAO58561.1 structural protein [Pseudomonas phage KPP25]
MNPITDEEARQSFLENAAAGAAGGGPVAAVSGTTTALASMPSRLDARAARAPDTIDPSLPVAQQAEQSLVRDALRSQQLELERQSLLNRTDLDDATRQELADTVLDLDPIAQERVAQLSDTMQSRDAALRELNRMQPEGVRASRRAPVAGFEQVDRILEGQEASHPAVRQYLDVLADRVRNGQTRLDARAARAPDTIDPSLPVAQQVEQSLVRDALRSQQLELERQSLLNRTDLDDATRQELADTVLDLDPIAQERVAQLSDTMQSRDAALRELNRMQPEGVRASRRAPVAGFEQVDRILEGQEASHPAVRQYLDVLADRVRNGQIDENTIDGALDVFGERAYSVLNALEPNEAAARAIRQDQQRRGDFDQFLLQSLRPEYRDTMRPQDLRQLSNALRVELTTGTGELQPFLERAFANPQQVLDGLDASLRGESPSRSTSEVSDAPQSAGALDDELDGGEFDQARTVESAAENWFGDTTGNRRIQTGGLGIPAPIARADTQRLQRAEEAARRANPDGSIERVPAERALRELGVDPADVAAELGLSPDALASSVLVRAVRPDATGAAQALRSVRQLRRSTVERLNQEPNNPSAGSYIAATTPEGTNVAVDLRRLVGAQVFGRRDAQALRDALSDGLGTLADAGYQFQLPDTAVVARYKDGSGEVAVTVADLRQGADQPRAGLPRDAIGLDSPTAEALQDLVQTYENPERTVQYARQADVERLIDEYAVQTLLGALQRRGGTATIPEAAARLLRAASPRGVALEGNTATLTSEPLPPAMDLGSLRTPGSPIDTLARTVADRGPMRESLRLLAQGAAQAQDPSVRDFWQRQLDRRPAPVDNTGTDEQLQRRNLEDFAAQQGMQELDPERMQAQTIEAATGQEGAAARNEPTPIGRRRPGPSPLDFGAHMNNVAASVQQRSWMNTTQTNVPGAWAAPMAAAMNGTPLKVAFALNRSEVLRSRDATNLMNAYTRRGFTISGTRLDVDQDTGPYSKSAYARILGPTGTDPVDVVITAGASTPAVMLARRIGVPVLDITVPAQAKIAGDLARAFDRATREDLHNRRESMNPAANREARRSLDTRQGVQRARDILGAGIDKQLSAQWADPAATERLLRLGRLSFIADDAFFEAGLAGRSVTYLSDNIDALEAYHQQYLSETSQQSARPQGASQMSQQQAKDLNDYITRVLPSDVMFSIEKLPGISGMFTEKLDPTRPDINGNPTMQRFIKVAVNAASPMSTAFHESMHALISVLRGQKQQSQFIKALDRAASNPVVLGKMRSLLANEPAALEQLSDPEERIAYMYELWASGMLDIQAQPQTWMSRFAGWIRGTLSILNNEQKAELYLQAFKDGKLRRPSAVNRVVMQSLSGPERALVSSRVADRVSTLTGKFLRTAHGRLKNYGNPALSKIADQFYARSDTQGQRAGYIQTVREVTNLFGTQLANIIKTMDEQQLADLSAALHRNVRPTDPTMAQKYDDTKSLLRRIFNYMKVSNVDVANVQDYFPQAWSREAIDADFDNFVDALVQVGQVRDDNGNWIDMTPDIASSVAETLTTTEGQLALSEDLAGYSPYMQAVNERKIRLKDRAAVAQYMDPDIVRVLTRYVTQAAKRGEYTKHFGRNGERLKDQLQEAKRYGLTDEQIERDVAPAIRALEGTLGSNIDPHLRSAMSGLITWQNLVVLPLSIFSSLIDPLGIVVRGGEVSDAWTAFKAGVRNIPQSLRRNGNKLDIQRFAEDVGTVEESFVLDLLGDMYGSNYMSDWARKTNNLLFKYNLMEGWNTAMRSAATVAAEKFIIRHAAGVNQHSTRYLDELGITAKDVQTDADGRLLFRAQDFIAQGMNPKDAIEKSRLVREAIGRWVDGAVLRPHAADRPAWASDPHWMLVWHLKQFTYSFQRTILDRATHELRNGNYAPMLTLAAYVPFMIAADFLKAMLQGAGDEPDWYKSQDAGDLIWRGVERAGLLGVRQFATDGIESPAFTLGPTFSYMLKAGEKTMDGDVTGAALSALPGNALWKDWIDR